MEQPNQNENSTNRDINDIFSDLLLAEERVIKQSYNEGYAIGLQQGNVESFHLGYHRGAQLAEEIGFIAGFTHTYLARYEQDECPSKTVADILKSLTDMLARFPHHNESDLDILELASEVRSKFKKLCALLKVSCPLYKNEGLSF